MRRNYLIILSLLFITITLNSCKPFYSCGEERPTEKKVTFFWTKRVKALLDERDILCKQIDNKRGQNALLERDTLVLRESIRKLYKTIDELQGKNMRLSDAVADLDGKYNSLLTDNLSQADQYNRALKQKSAELQKKEKELAEQRALLEEQTALLTTREATLKELQDKLATQDSITNALNDVIRKALLGFASDELSVELKNGKVYVSMSNKLLFKSGKWDVEAKGKEALLKLAEVLNNNPDIDIMIEGHTDSDPIRTAIIKDNWDLSTARANSIVRILTTEYSVQPKRVTAAGRGEFIPKASNETEEGKAINRRTEIILSPKLDEIFKLLGE